VKGNLCFILQKLAQFSDVYASKLIPFQALNAPGNSATPTSNFARSHVEIFCKSLCPIFEDMERALSIVDGIWSEGYHNTIKKVYEDMQKGAKDSKFRPLSSQSLPSPLIHGSYLLRSSWHLSTWNTDVITLKINMNICVSI